MLTTDLLERNAGITSPFGFAQKQTTRLIHALQPAPRVSFDGKPRTLEDRSASYGNERSLSDVVAHKSGANAIAVERYEGRYLASAAANGSISMWDLEASQKQGRDGHECILHCPLGSVDRSGQGHGYGITGLSFYPFDSLAFLASSYDHTVKVYDSTSLSLSATFDLGSVVYSHAISPIADHLLVACATQHPAVRLADMRSGSTAQSLAGHGGAAVLSVSWSPKDEYVLASGASDGSLRIWDVRRSAGSIGVLDMEDSLGVMDTHGEDHAIRNKQYGKAHIGPVNGLTWTGDGKYLVSAGHDERIRVWDIAVGANTLANFGAIVRNTDLAATYPLVAPQALTPPNEDVLVFPNGREILMFELYEGQLLKRMKALNVAASSKPSNASGQRNVRNRVVDLAWRTHHVELLSAHTDGTIRSWRPHTSTDAIVDETEKEDQETESDSRKRKRQTLNDIYREITAPKLTFT